MQGLEYKVFQRVENHRDWNHVTHGTLSHLTIHQTHFCYITIKRHALLFNGWTWDVKIKMKKVRLKENPRLVLAFRSLSGPRKSQSIIALEQKPPVFYLSEVTSEYYGHDKMIDLQYRVFLKKVLHKREEKMQETRPYTRHKMRSRSYCQ